MRISWFQNVKKWLSSIPMPISITYVEMTRARAADDIENFLEDRGDPYDWDDFLSVSTRDPGITRVRDVCSFVAIHYPPEVIGHYCSVEGLEVLRNLVQVLRRSDSEQDDRILKEFIDDYWFQHVKYTTPGLVDR